MRQTILTEYERIMTNPMRVILVSLMAFVWIGGCSSDPIPNTTVEDTSENRAVIDFVEKYRHALQRKDVGAMLALVSPRYLDDNGTPSGTDDIDYQNLKVKLNLWKEKVLDVRYEIRYRKITAREDRILVDYTYTGHYRIQLPDGNTRWSRHLADNRLALIRVGDSFQILSGM